MLVSTYASNTYNQQASSSDSEDDEDYKPNNNVNDPYLMTDDERREWRSKIRQVISNIKPQDLEEEELPLDVDEKRTKMQDLLANYPLVVEEDDPDWPEDADGWGFNLGRFFDKITIKNNPKKHNDDDDDYDSENEIVWQDDNYIRPIKDITTSDWEHAVFKDISPLIVLVHHRYKRFHFSSLACFYPTILISNEKISLYSQAERKWKNSGRIGEGSANHLEL